MTLYGVHGRRSFPVWLVESAHLPYRTTRTEQSLRWTIFVDTLP
jgi:hypothetical protein